MSGLEEDTEPEGQQGQIGAKKVSEAKASRSSKAPAKQQMNDQKQPKTGGAKKEHQDTREVVWGRVTPTINEHIKAYAKTYNMSKSDVLHEALSMFLEHHHGEIAWERAILRMDRRISSMEKTLEKMMEIQLWHLRLYASISGPVPESSKTAFEMVGQARWSRFIRDMLQTDVCKELREELEAKPRPAEGLPAGDRGRP
jgi:hypothetical protein